MNSPLDSQLSIQHKHIVHCDYIKAKIGELPNITGKIRKNNDLLKQKGKFLDFPYNSDNS